MSRSSVGKSRNRKGLLKFESGGAGTIARLENVESCRDYCNFECCVSDEKKIVRSSRGESGLPL